MGINKNSDEKITPDKETNQQNISLQSSKASNVLELKNKGLRKNSGKIAITHPSFSEKRKSNIKSVNQIQVNESLLSP